MTRKQQCGQLADIGTMAEAGNGVAGRVRQPFPECCLAATDIETVMQRCRDAGLRLLDETPRTGAGGKQIVFVHPKDTGGVLLEICMG